MGIVVQQGIDALNALPDHLRPKRQVVWMKPEALADFHAGRITAKDLERDLGSQTPQFYNVMGDHGPRRQETPREVAERIGRWAAEAIAKRRRERYFGGDQWKLKNGSVVNMIPPGQLPDDRPAHQRIEAAERAYLAAMDEKITEAVGKIQHDGRWKSERDNMAGNAIHGPGKTFIPIRNDLVARVLEAALRGDLIALQIARADFIEAVDAAAKLAP